MRIRTYEIKDGEGNLVDSGTKCWWNHQIVLSWLSPLPTGGIGGEVSANGGWCTLGNWFEPETPITLRSSANRWAQMVSEKLVSSGDNSPEGVINAIAYALEVLEDERLSKNTSQSVVDD